MIIYQKWIKREDLRNNPECMYVFGDNVKRVGLGGQAAAMRGEPNAIGIATLWAPGVPYSDAEYGAARDIIIADLERLDEHRRNSFYPIVFPADGIGTGLARMKLYCPKIFEFLNEELARAFKIKNGLSPDPRSSILGPQQEPKANDQA